MVQCDKGTGVLARKTRFLFQQSLQGPPGVLTFVRMTGGRDLWLAISEETQPAVILRKGAVGTLNAGSLSPDYVQPHHTPEEILLSVCQWHTSAG